MKKFLSVLLTVMMITMISLPAAASEPVDAVQKTQMIAENVIVNGDQIQVVLDKDKLLALDPNEEVLLFEENFVTGSYSSERTKATVVTYVSLSASYSRGWITLTTKAYSSNSNLCTFFDVHGIYNIGNRFYEEFEEGRWGGADSITCRNTYSIYGFVSDTAQKVTANGSHLTNFGWTNFSRSVIFLYI